MMICNRTVASRDRGANIDVRAVITCMMLEIDLPGRLYVHAYDSLITVTTYEK